MTLEKKYINLQPILKKMGENGCLFLSLCAEVEKKYNKKIDLVEAARLAIEKGFMTLDFWMADSCAFLHMLTDVRFDRIKTTAATLATLKEKDVIVVVKSINKRTQEIHFISFGLDTWYCSTERLNREFSEFYVYIPRRK